MTSLQREKTLAEGLNVKSSQRVSKYATEAGSENFCLLQAAMRCEQRGAVHSDSVTSKETDGDQWSALIMDRMIGRTLDLIFHAGMAAGIAT